VLASGCMGVAGGKEAADAAAAAAAAKAAARAGAGAIGGGCPAWACGGSKCNETRG
jgi:hypothetical protein